MFRHSIASSVVLLSTLFFSGCSAPPSTDQHASPSVSNLAVDPLEVDREVLRERLVTAAQVSSLAMRDRAFGVIALDAAAGGEVALCLEAILGISSLSARDDHAVKASSVVHRLGLLAGGRQIAQEISSLSLRDDALSAIAAGSLK